MLTINTNKLEISCSASQDELFANRLQIHKAGLRGQISIRVDHGVFIYEASGASSKHYETKATDLI